MQKSTLALCALFLLETAAYARADGSPPQTFDIGPQALSSALTAFARQSHDEILFSPDVVTSKKTSGVKGTMTAVVALRVLLKDSGLPFSSTPSGALLVGNSAGIEAQSRAQSALADDTQTQEVGKKSSQDFRVAQVDQANTGPQVAISSNDSKKKAELEEVVVTGTLIHGTEPTSRVATYTRDEIQDQGFSSVKDFVQSLPQNLNNISEQSLTGIGTGGQGEANQVNGSAVNLRGLGGNSTLVLLNGKRVAPGNVYGDFVDISMIPLSAIERIDVMPDGASAIYGSDAVGGVVNVILRKNVEGAETSLRYGSVTRGGRLEEQLAQSFGHAWNGGSALLVYEYDRTTALMATDRDFAANVPSPTSLLPKTQLQSVLANVEQDIAGNIELFGDGTFSHRTNLSDVAGLLGPGSTSQIGADAKSYSGVGGLRGPLTDNLNFEVVANFSRSNTTAATSYSGIGEFDTLADTKMISVDGKVDGTLFTIPTGQVRIAVGAQYRKEDFASRVDENVPESVLFQNDRHIDAGFAELHVPVIGPSDAGGAAVLELEAADRYERYSDFGDTNNPKVGFIWRSSPHLTIRGNYSTSFVAPLLNDLNPIPSQVVAIPGNFLGGIEGSQGRDAIFIFGGNPDLKPQKSKNWTLATDLDFVESIGLRAYANYFHIDYNDRITNAQTLINIFQAFQYQNVLGPTIVETGPSAAYLQALEATTGFQNFGVPNLATISAVVDSRQQNLSTVKTDGLDFGVSEKWSAALGAAEVGIDGTYIASFKDQFSPSAPLTSFLNRAYNPVGVKLRARGSVQRGPLTIGAFVNYVNSYENDVSGKLVPIASWTTVDLVGKYSLPSATWLLRKTSILIGVTNVTNRAPPYVLNASPNYAINYDGANANPLGRFVYLQLNKQW